MPSSRRTTTMSRSSRIDAQGDCRVVAGHGLLDRQDAYPWASNASTPSLHHLNMKRDADEEAEAFTTSTSSPSASTRCRQIIAENHAWSVQFQQEQTSSALMQHELSCTLHKLSAMKRAMQMYVATCHGLKVLETGTLADRVEGGLAS